MWNRVSMLHRSLTSHTPAKAKNSLSSDLHGLGGGAFGHPWVLRVPDSGC
jgi:hypothetical protein